MSTTHPRLTAVVEPVVYDAVEQLARHDHVSLSQKVRDLLLGALELTEDAALEGLVEQRKKISKRSYSLAEAKRHFKIK